MKNYSRVAILLECINDLARSSGRMHRDERGARIDENFAEYASLGLQVSTTIESHLPDYRR